MSMITSKALAAAMPHVLAAPRSETIVDHLCFRPAPNQRSFPNQLRLTTAEGTPGDRWLAQPWLRLPDGRPDPSIQVSILPLRVLNLVWQDRDNTPHPGDTMVADLDCSEANLPEGTLIRAGGAVLRVSAVFNDGCVKWAFRYGKPAKAWITAPGHASLRLRGILCAVEQDGDVAAGDKLIVLR